MAGYADLDEAKRRLRLDDGNPSHVDMIDALGDLDEALSRLFDALTDATFDASAGSVARTYDAPGVSPVLLLGTPARAITSVVEGGTWDGSAWAGEETLDADAWYPWPDGTYEDGSFTGIVRASGLWGGRVRVTGTWGDDPGTGVPAVVTDALTHAVVLEWRRRAAAPDGTLNGDEFAVETAVFLKDPVWKAAVDRYSAPRRAGMIV